MTYNKFTIGQKGIRTGLTCDMAIDHQCHVDEGMEYIRYGAHWDDENADVVGVMADGYRNEHMRVSNIRDSPTFLHCQCQILFSTRKKERKRKKRKTSVNMCY